MVYVKLFQRCKGYVLSIHVWTGVHYLQDNTEIWRIYKTVKKYRSKTHFTFYRICDWDIIYMIYDDSKLKNPFVSMVYVKLFQRCKGYVLSIHVWTGVHYLQDNTEIWRIYKTVKKYRSKTHFTFYRICDWDIIYMIYDDSKLKNPFVSMVYVKLFQRCKGYVLSIHVWTGVHYLQDNTEIWRIYKTVKIYRSKTHFTFYRIWALDWYDFLIGRRLKVLFFETTRQNSPRRVTIDPGVIISRKYSFPSPALINGAYHAEWSWWPGVRVEPAAHETSGQRRLRAVSASAMSFQTRVSADPAFLLAGLWSRLSWTSYYWQYLKSTQPMAEDAGLTSTRCWANVCDVGPASNRR